MDADRQTRISKFLSLVLRHTPERIGITLDQAGWTPIDDLLKRSAIAGICVSRDELQFVLRNCAKQRFAISEDGLRIRANQGHSQAVDLGYSPAVPPTVLYHGTHLGVMEVIRLEGLRKMARHHVHLSSDRATAMRVGQRRGRPLVLEVNSGQMATDGYMFFQSTNGVWLTDNVPQEYLKFPP